MLIINLFALTGPVSTYRVLLTAVVAKVISYRLTFIFSFSHSFADFACQIGLARFVIGEILAKIIRLINALTTVNVTVVELLRQEK